ncbi:hypothetical protein HanPSC8_Chr14g0597741 [Helianthus annuus]|nr:hypothetical protein HanPSC8_Chr14g0597741 [Helianthus annuus]
MTCLYLMVQTFLFVFSYFYYMYGINTGLCQFKRDYGLDGRSKRILIVEKYTNIEYMKCTPENDVFLIHLEFLEQIFTN